MENRVNIILLTSKYFIFSESFDKNSTGSYMSSFSGHINFNYGRPPIGSKKKGKGQIGYSRLVTHVKTSLFVPWRPRQCLLAWGDWVWISSLLIIEEFLVFFLSSQICGRPFLGHANFDTAPQWIRFTSPCFQASNVKECCPLGIGSGCEDRCCLVDIFIDLSALICGIRPKAYSYLLHPQLKGGQVSNNGMIIDTLFDIKKRGSLSDFQPCFLILDFLLL